MSLRIGRKFAWFDSSSIALDKIISLEIDASIKPASHKWIMWVIMMAAALFAGKMHPLFYIFLATSFVFMTLSLYNSTPETLYSITITTKNSMSYSAVTTDYDQVQRLQSAIA